MRTLVVGGTRFVGKHLVDALLQRGHEVTLLNRGRTRPGLFAEVNRIVGDRDADLSALRGRDWDLVVDTCAYRSEQVARLLDVVGGHTTRYVLVSTISVYAESSDPGITEDGDLHTRIDAGHVTPETYGGLKVGCEEAARARMPDDRLLVVRPGLVVGPEDHTWRFPYWVERVANGGAVLAPAPADNPVQVVDARDLAMFVVRSAEVGAAGTFHVTGPVESLTFGDTLDRIDVVAKADAEVVWVDRSWLADHGVEPGVLPLAVEPDASANLFRLDAARALGSGLSLRTLAETIADTLAWIRASADARPESIGLDPHREQELLSAWTRLT
jgi:2'-hydroxyisoflavone reductase